MTGRNPPQDMGNLDTPRDHGGQGGADASVDPWGVRDPRVDAELESLLRAMPLRRPSGGLDQRVLCELRQAKRLTHACRRLRLSRTWAAAASVAATVALAFTVTTRLLPPRHPVHAGPGASSEPTRLGTTGLPAGPGLPALTVPGRGPGAPVVPATLSSPAAGAAAGQAAPTPRPLRVIRTLAGVADDGVVGTVNGVPVRRIRRATVQQVVVFDPGRGTYVTYRRPTEQVLLVAAPAF